MQRTRPTPSSTSRTVPPKRAWHIKARTGCFTCKARKIRCDEGKPYCNRCTSTGRKCAGYASQFICVNGSRTSDNTFQTTFEDGHLIPRQNTKVILPRHDEKELRSFRFFLERTAPSYAGVFQVDFWLREIPRACHEEAALWHAAVSLGAVDESYSVKGGMVPSYVMSDSQVRFALEQFSLSVKRLIDPSHRLRGSTSKETALAASILFTCICSIQGLQAQGFVHLRGGLKLLREVEAESQQSGRFTARSSSRFSPVSFAAMQSVLSDFDIQAEALLGGRMDPELQPLNKVDSYNIWRHYQPPPLLSDSTPPNLENIVQACKAAESLFNSMVVFLRKPEIFQAAITGDFETVWKQQLPFMRPLRSLTSALEVFEGCAQCVSNEPKQKAILVCKMFCVVCRLLILPKTPQPGRLDWFESQLKQVVDLADQVLDEESRTRFTPMSEGTMQLSEANPKSATTMLLLVAAVISRSIMTRSRAIGLMKKYPQRQGLWDSLMAAELAKNILQAKGLPFTAAEGEMTAAVYDDIDEAPANYMITVAFDGERRAQITAKTFDEWTKGETGTQRSINW